MNPKIELLPQFNPSVFYPLYLIRNRLLKDLRHFIPKLEGKILDFGCGIKPYQSLFNVDEYIGVDYAGEGETYSKSEVDFIYDGNTLPFANETFDGIFSSEVAEHVFNLPQIFIELNRVLKADGSILITCPFSMPEHEVPNDFARYTSFAVKDLLEKSGFKIIEYRKTGNFVEALFQLQLIYIDQSILSVFKNIPVIRSLFRWSIYGLLNISALLWSQLLPTNKALYLNNIILAKKQK